MMTQVPNTPRPGDFKSCGRNVVIHPGVHVEHPEAIEVGDDVTFMSGVHIIGKPKRFSIGSNVSFYPNVFIQGSPGEIRIGNHVEFFPGNYVSGGEWDSCFIRIGDHTHFAPMCVLYGWGGLSIGNYVAVAANTVFATVGHFYDKTERPMVTYGENAGPITVEDDVWICASCVITAHTTIRRGCVIAAGAVLTKDTEPYGVYMGTPAALKSKRR